MLRRGRKGKLEKQLEELISASSSKSVQLSSPANEFTEPARKAVTKAHSGKGDGQFDSSYCEVPEPKRARLDVENERDTDSSKLMKEHHVSQEQAQNNFSWMKIDTQFGEAVLLIQIAKHIPTNFKAERVRLAKGIINSTMATNYTEANVKSFLEEADKSLSNAKSSLLFNSPADEILWNATEKLEEPVNKFLSPPVSKCLSCNSNLHTHHSPTVVTVFTTNGPLPGQKITLRCKKCNINYRYDTYGDEEGFKYYDCIRDFIAASNVCYIERSLCESWVSACHHGWVSFECSAEIYNETMRVTRNLNHEKFRKFGQSNPKVTINEDDEDKAHYTAGDVHRKRVANAFWTYQIQEEINENHNYNYVFKGQKAKESFMTEVDIKRANGVYSHLKCTKDCKQRGCGQLWAIDGNWKLRYPICMYSSPKQISAFSGGLDYVDACPNSPLQGMAFCEEHCEALQSKGVPVKLREYVEYKKKNELPVLGDSNLSTSEFQGIKDTIKVYEDTARAIDSGEKVQENKTIICNKDTGEKETLQRWTRGLWFSVSGGGHIHSWQPLYKSEGPAQVFFLTLLWLVSEFGAKGREFWKKMTISYDNMCNLNNLLVARRPLPLPGDLKHIWEDVNKVIDDLHIKNHRDPSCHKLYSTENLRQQLPEANTIAAEQTFAWLSRHKKVLCAMPKVHFHFYLHRLVKRRNAYIEHCYETGKRVLSPKIKNRSSL